MALSPAPRNIAVVHDWLVDRGGAERVLEQILEVVPGATLYTLIDRMAPADRQRLCSGRTVTSWLDRLPQVTRYFTRCLPLMPAAMQQFDLSGHDLVISSSHCVAKGVIVPPDALHLCYCHSPMRYVWDLQGEYLRTEGLDRGVSGWAARRLFHRLRQWDAASSNGVDGFAANSQFVRQRIRKAWRREAEVIHPPVDLPPVLPATERRAGHYVTVGRLMGYKNVATMLEAFRLMPERQLTVIGTGPLESALRRAAPANVRFTGFLPEDVVREQVRSAQAFVFAAVEDFGIAPVEALALGTPVIAQGRGGVLDYLEHGRTGWLYEGGSAQALAGAVRASADAWDASVGERCRAAAQPFEPARFRRDFADWLQRGWAAWREDGGARR